MTPASPTTTQYVGTPIAHDRAARSSSSGPKKPSAHAPTHAMHRIVDDAPARAHHSRSKSVEKRLTAPTNRISPSATAARNAGGAIVM